MAASFTKDAAQQRVNQFTDQVVLYDYSGKVTTKSLWYHKANNYYFLMTLQNVVRHFQSGRVLDTLGTKGTVGSHSRTSTQKPTQEDLLSFLKENCPDVDLLSFSGSYSTKSLFVRNERIYALEVNRLKDKLRRGLIPFASKDERVNRATKTRQENGLDILYEGKTPKEWAEQLGVAYSTFQAAAKHKGLEAAKLLSPRESFLESLIAQRFPTAIRNKQLLGTSFRPDFLFPEHRVIVEVDGLYWHSEVWRDRHYHDHKRREYILQGFTPLFFRANEVLGRTEVVHSVIGHRLGLSRKVHGRKTDVVSLPKAESQEFFSASHLMGPGAGQTLALTLNGQVVAALQYRTNFGMMEVSRFSTANGVHVHGGFSKLLKALRNTTQLPIFTYIDLRYGTGEHLSSLGFVQVNTPSPSFRWTNFRRTWHRLKFTEAEAADSGLVKIWDCGHTKFVLNT